MQRHPQAIELRHLQQRLGGGGAAGRRGEERSGVGVARGDGAVERSAEDLVTLLSARANAARATFTPSSAASRSWTETRPEEESRSTRESCCLRKVSSARAEATCSSSSGDCAHPIASSRPRQPGFLTVFLVWTGIALFSLAQSTLLRATSH